MIKVRKKDEMGYAKHEWLESIHHFSFAEYYDSSNINFGVLRVVNDDIVKPHTGFAKHPHQNMEILSYIIEGELTHVDSMGNQSILKKGELQYMSAGTGVFHSEENQGDVPVRFLQIWIIPEKENVTPKYGDFRFDWSKRLNQWLRLVSKDNLKAPVQLNQDVEISVIYLEEGKKTDYPVDVMRQIYLVQIEGKSKINNVEVFQQQAAEITDEFLTITAIENSHIMIIDMPKTKNFE